MVGAQDMIQFIDNSLQASNPFNTILWADLYNKIYNVNSSIESLNASNTLSTQTRNRLLGEVKFLRAFCYFYLVNCYGDVPLLVSTDYKVNAIAPRDPLTKVYEQIIADLKDAETLLPPDYSRYGGERIRAISPAAKSLLARVYLYREDWANAEAKATEVIEDQGLYKIENNLDSVFLANSNEAIWQLRPVVPGNNSGEGSYFLPSDGYMLSALRKEFIPANPGTDKRVANWINSFSNGEQFFYPFKYKIYMGVELKEYSMVLRLAEQYLIRAEARVRQGKVTGDPSAATDINVIRKRAGLGNTTATTQPDMMLVIENERKLEFFCEWGHRWFDLKRTRRAGAVLSGIKTGWQPTDQLYPIPKTEREANTSLTQNDGY
jgi:hypothetical protein